LSGISPFFFRIAPPDNVGTKRLVDWMVEDGAERIAVVFSDDEYGRGQKDVGVKRLQEIRMSPVELASCPRNTEDHRALAVRVRSAKPDSVLLLTGGTEAGPFLRAARDLGFAPRFYGDDSLGSPYLAELAGRAAEGARFLWPTEGSGPLYEAFAKSFRRAYKGEPGDPAMRGYSLLVTAAEALENTTLDGPALRAFLSKHAVDTPMGIVAFDQNGDIVNPRYDKHEYRNGDASTLASE
jgi:branched-chain amino acid transport system substrate-binding protein